MNITKILHPFEPKEDSPFNKKTLETTNKIIYFEYLKNFKKKMKTLFLIKIKTLTS